MNETAPLDTEVIPSHTPNQSLTVRPEPGALAPATVEPGKSKSTAQELRVVEVSEALLPAYQKASTLDLSDEEIESLMADFPDSAVEIRPHDGLIYLPHIEISNRLNQVLKPGKWSLVCRRHWLDGLTMYGEYVLLIRGCYVGESVGGHPYQPNNPKTNYSDTLESTASEALRRIAGKRLSCGSQVWIPEYARQWVAKHGVQTNGKWHKRAQESHPPTARPSTTTQTPQQAQAPAKARETAILPTVESRGKMLLSLKAGPGEANRAICTEYFEKLGQLLPGEQPEDLPLRFVPATTKQMRDLADQIARFGDGEPAAPAFPPHAMETDFPEAKAPARAPKEKPPVDRSGLEQITGTITRVSRKEGSSAKGPWVLFGIQIAGGWINTFSDTLAGIAVENEGKEVTIWYTKTEKGRTAQDIEAADDLPS